MAEDREETRSSAPCGLSGRARLRAATATRRVTPTEAHMPCYLMGHAIRTERATGVLDDLWATALVLEADDVRTVWVSVDLIGLERAYTDGLRARIADLACTAADLVHVGFVHTHAAPEYQEVSLFGGSGRGAVPGYMDWVTEQVMGAVEDALRGGLVPVEARGSRVEVEGFYANRNGLEKPSDQEVSLLEFVDGGGATVAGTFCFSCHSTVLGPQNLKVSADLAGWLATGIERRWGARPVCMVGAAGDMSHRQCRQGNDAAELKRVGDGVLACLPDHASTALDVHAPRVATFHVGETFVPDRDEKRRQYEEIQSRLEYAETFDEYKVYSSALRMAELGLEARPFELDLTCTLIDMGDVRILTMPAELFSRFGVRIKSALAAKHPLCWCYCDHNIGYLGNIEDYGASFETAASDIPAGFTERLVDDICAFIEAQVD